MSATDEREARKGWAAMMLGVDVAACQGLIAGFAVPRDRLRAEVLRALSEPVDGDPVVLDDGLALRVEVARTLFARRVNLPRRRGE